MENTPVCHPNDFSLKTSVIAALVSVENPASSKFIEMLPAVMFLGPMFATAMATWRHSRRFQHDLMIASAQPKIRSNAALATYIATYKFFAPELDASNLVNRVTKGHTPKRVVGNRQHTFVE